MNFLLLQKILFILAAGVNSDATAQSPALYVNVKMDSAAEKIVSYKIEMKLCEPLKKSATGNYFGNENSTIDFTALTEKDVKCGNYISTDNTELRYNNFHFGNQVYAWERILVYRISNYSSRGWWPEMYIVLPVKTKSFITFIDLTGIVFQSGKVIWINDAGVINKEGRQNITLSLKAREGVEKDSCLLKKILD